MSKPRIVLHGRPNIYFRQGIWRVARPHAISYTQKDGQAVLHAVKLNETTYGAIKQ